MHKPFPAYTTLLVVILLTAYARAADPASSVPPAPAAPPTPNVVFILVDDLGYGDLGCYGATKVKTPAMDSLARDGVRFTDAHAPAAVCSPTRYAILTGKEWWRHTTPWHGELLVPTDSLTLPSVFKAAGYATACVGKWHLGFGLDKPDWNVELSPGPLEVGFDHYFGTPNSHSEPPEVLIENHRVVELNPNDPITILPPSDGHPYGTMKGGKSAKFNPENLATLNTDKAVSFIERNKTRPFFLYFATNSLHVPISPSPRFRNTSRAGIYGDFIQELDGSVGEVLAALDRCKLADNTLVVLTSDNGGVLHRAAMKFGHYANGDLLGQKTDIWEGGHRVPFIARWPGRIKPGTTSDELICLSDTLATMAAVLGKDLPHDAGPDSFNALPALLNTPGHKPVRPLLVIHGTDGLAIRQGQWVVYPKHGSGGFSADPNDKSWSKFWQADRLNSDYTPDGTLRPDAPPGQLYDLQSDPRETTNLFSQHPDIVNRLLALMKNLKTAGRSRP